MATSVCLQLVRVAGLRESCSSSYPVSIQRSEVILKKRSLERSSLKIASNHRVGSLQGEGALCCPLWNYVDISQRSPHVRPVRLPFLACSGVPVEQKIKKTAVIFINYGAHLLKRTTNLVQLCPPLVAQTAPALGVVAFSIWGLGPSARFLRKTLFKRNDKKWDESRTYDMVASYMRPILLWIGIILICRAFDPVVLSTEASQAIKQRFVNFVRSLSTVLAFAFCTASLTQQVQKFMMEHQDTEDARNVGVQFIGNTVYTSVWVAAVCLFMELLGFSTQKWITAGGFGTVLITLAGREIFTNFLSSIMIHATRPFVDNEWIQTKIEGQEVSGTVEHVGWWSPTVIRGDDREAVHIPNHKFSVSVVRNLSQKTHWRIKTHLGISHLDVSKMTAIVSDMRKVLSKHPQVEQHRLHRRVFFDNIDPENQALLILVSCFVKTSHFEEYLRVKEIILLDLLKVISHHNARLATPIRSVQRVLDESESRSAPFRDMRSASQANRRPFLLMEAQALANDDEDEDDDDVSDDISQLSVDLAKSTKAAPSADSEDSDVSAEEPNDLKVQKAIKKLKESVSLGDGIVGVAASGTTVRQAGAKGPSTDKTLPQDSSLTERILADVHGSLTDKPHAGMEVNNNGSVQAQGGDGKASLEQPVAASHVLAAELVIEKPEETVPSLYSNNVGLDDVTDQVAESVSSESSDDPWKQPPLSQLNDNDVLVQSLNTYSIGPDDLNTQDVVSTRSTSTDDPWRQPPSQLIVGKHVGDQVSGTLSLGNTDDPWREPSSLHVQAESTASNDGRWRQPSTSQVNSSELSADVVGSTLPSGTDDPWRQPSTPQGHDHSMSNQTAANLQASTDDPRKQQSASQGIDAQRVQPKISTVDTTLVPGVVIEGPKHTLPLDEDIIILGESRTLVTSNSSKERRESSSHTVAKGVVSSDKRDMDR